MEVVQTITLTEEEQNALAEAFEIMDKMSDVVKDKSTYDICCWFCEYGIEYGNGEYVVQKCIQIDEL